LTLPVIVALYWHRTTRAGMFAGIGIPQLFYLASVFLPQVPGAFLGGWEASLFGMGLGLVLTIGVSLITTPAASERAASFDGLRAD
jgi:SSS family solute:Na+ symporter